MITQGYAEPAVATYLFVDGESFRQALEDISKIYFDGESLEVNWVLLRGSSRKAFYYDAVPVMVEDEAEDKYSSRVAPKLAELSHIESQPGYHVKTGDMRWRRKRGNEQKMVDVQLAVDAMHAASRGLFSKCALVTGDLDFRPLIAALVDMGVDVTLFYPPGHTSKDLLAAADNVIPIDLTSALTFLDLNETQRMFVPNSVLQFQGEPRPVGPELIRWEDARYGNCCVLQIDGRFMLVTARSPSHPSTHRLQLEAKRLDHLRHFALSRFDLSVPDSQ